MEIWQISWAAFSLGISGFFAGSLAAVIIGVVALLFRKPGLLKLYIPIALLFALCFISLAIGFTLGPLDSPSSF